MQCYTVVMASRYILGLRVGCLDPFTDIRSYCIEANECIRCIRAMDTRLCHHEFILSQTRINTKRYSNMILYYLALFGLVNQGHVCK